MDFCLVFYRLCDDNFPAAHRFTGSSAHGIIESVPDEDVEIN